MTEVIAPGPASKGNASGTTPEPSVRVSPPNLQAPWVNSSIELTIKFLPRS
jgi:hypothetical protein